MRDVRFKVSAEDQASQILEGIRKEADGISQAIEDAANRVNAAATSQLNSVQNIKSGLADMANLSQTASDAVAASTKVIKTSLDSQIGYFGEVADVAEDSARRVAAAAESIEDSLSRARSAQSSIMDDDDPPKRGGRGGGGSKSGGGRKSKEESGGFGFADLGQKFKDVFKGAKRELDEFDQHTRSILSKIRDAMEDALEPFVSGLGPQLAYEGAGVTGRPRRESRLSQSAFRASSAGGGGGGSGRRNEKKEVSELEDAYEQAGDTIKDYIKILNNLKNANEKLEAANQAFENTSGEDQLKYIKEVENAEKARAKALDKAQQASQDLGESLVGLESNLQQVLQDTQKVISVSTTQSAYARDLMGMMERRAELSAKERKEQERIAQESERNAARIQSYLQAEQQALKVNLKFRQQQLNIVDQIVQAEIKAHQLVSQTSRDTHSQAELDIVNQITDAKQVSLKITNQLADAEAQTHQEVFQQNQKIAQEKARDAANIQAYLDAEQQALRVNLKVLNQQLEVVNEIAESERKAHQGVALDSAKRRAIAAESQPSPILEQVRSSIIAAQQAAQAVERAEARKQVAIIETIGLLKRVQDVDESQNILDLDLHSIRILEQIAIAANERFEIEAKINRLLEERAALLKEAPRKQRLSEHKKIDKALEKERASLRELIQLEDELETHSEQSERRKQRARRDSFIGTYRSDISQAQEREPGQHPFDRLAAAEKRLADAIAQAEQQKQESLHETSQVINEQISSYDRLKQAMLEFIAEVQIDRRIKAWKMYSRSEISAEEAIQMAREAGRLKDVASAQKAAKALEQAEQQKQNAIKETAKMQKQPVQQQQARSNPFAQEQQRAWQEQQKVQQDAWRQQQRLLQQQQQAQQQQSQAVQGELNLDKELNDLEKAEKAFKDFISTVRKYEAGELTARLSPGGMPESAYNQVEQAIAALGHTLSRVSADQREFVNQTEMSTKAQQELNRALAIARSLAGEGSEGEWNRRKKEILETERKFKDKQYQPQEDYANKAYDENAANLEKLGKNIGFVRAEFEKYLNKITAASRISDRFSEEQQDIFDHASIGAEKLLDKIQQLIRTFDASSSAGLQFDENQLKVTRNLLQEISEAKFEDVSVSGFEQVLDTLTEVEKRVNKVYSTLGEEAPENVVELLRKEEINEANKLVEIQRELAAVEERINSLLRERERLKGEGGRSVYAKEMKSIDRKLYAERKTSRGLTEDLLSESASEKQRLVTDEIKSANQSAKAVEQAEEKKQQSLEETTASINKHIRVLLNSIKQMESAYDFNILFGKSDFLSITDAGEINKYLTSLKQVDTSVTQEIRKAENALSGFRESLEGTGADYNHLIQNFEEIILKSKTYSEIINRMFKGLDKEGDDYLKTLTEHYTSINKIYDLVSKRSDLYLRIAHTEEDTLNFKSDKHIGGGKFEGVFGAKDFETLRNFAPVNITDFKGDLRIILGDAEDLSETVTKDLYESIVKVRKVLLSIPDGFANQKHLFQLLEALEDSSSVEQAEEKKQQAIRETARVTQQLREAGQDVRSSQRTSAATAFETAEKKKQESILETIRVTKELREAGQGLRTAQRSAANVQLEIRTDTNIDKPVQKFKEFGDLRDAVKYLDDFHKKLAETPDYKGLDEITGSIKVVSEQIKRLDALGAAANEPVTELRNLERQIDILYSSIKEGEELTGATDFIEEVIKGLKDLHLQTNKLKTGQTDLAQEVSKAGQIQEEVVEDTKNGYAQLISQINSFIQKTTVLSDMSSQLRSEASKRGTLDDRGSEDYKNIVDILNQKKTALSRVTDGVKFFAKELQKANELTPDMAQRLQAIIELLNSMGRSGNTSLKRFEKNMKGISQGLDEIAEMSKQAGTQFAQSSQDAAQSSQKSEKQIVESSQNISKAQRALMVDVHKSGKAFLELYDASSKPATAGEHEALNQKVKDFNVAIAKLVKTFREADNISDDVINKIRAVSNNIKTSTGSVDEFVAAFRTGTKDLDKLFSGLTGVSQQKQQVNKAADDVEQAEKRKQESIEKTLVSYKEFIDFVDNHPNLFWRKAASEEDSSTYHSRDFEATGYYTNARNKGLPHRLPPDSYYREEDESAIDTRHGVYRKGVFATEKLASQVSDIKKINDELEYFKEHATEIRVIFGKISDIPVKNDPFRLKLFFDEVVIKDVKLLYSQLGKFPDQLQHISKELEKIDSNIRERVESYNKIQRYIHAEKQALTVNIKIQQRSADVVDNVLQKEIEAHKQVALATKQSENNKQKVIEETNQSINEQIEALKNLIKEKKPLLQRAGTDSDKALSKFGKQEEYYSSIRVPSKQETEIFNKAAQAVGRTSQRLQDRAIAIAEAIIEIRKLSGQEFDIDVEVNLKSDTARSALTKELERLEEIFGLSEESVEQSEEQKQAAIRETVNLEKKLRGAGQGVRTAQMSAAAVSPSVQVGQEELNILRQKSDAQRQATQAAQQNAKKAAEAQARINQELEEAERLHKEKIEAQRKADEVSKAAAKIFDQRIQAESKAADEMHAAFERKIASEKAADKAAEEANKSQVKSWEEQARQHIPKALEALRKYEERFIELRNQTGKTLDLGIDEQLINHITEASKELKKFKDILESVYGSSHVEVENLEGYLYGFRDALKGAKAGDPRPTSWIYDPNELEAFNRVPLDKSEEDIKSATQHLRKYLTEVKRVAKYEQERQDIIDAGQEGPLYKRLLSINKNIQGAIGRANKAARSFGETLGSVTDQGDAQADVAERQAKNVEILSKIINKLTKEQKNLLFSSSDGFKELVARLSDTSEEYENLQRHIRETSQQSGPRALPNPFRTEAVQSAINYGMAAEDYQDARHNLYALQRAESAAYHEQQEAERILEEKRAAQQKVNQEVAEAERVLRESVAAQNKVNQELEKAEQLYRQNAAAVEQSEQQKQESIRETARLTTRANEHMEAASRMPGYGISSAESNRNATLQVIRQSEIFAQAEQRKQDAIEETIKATRRWGKVLLEVNEQASRGWGVSRGTPVSRQISDAQRTQSGLQAHGWGRSSGNINQSVQGWRKINSVTQDASGSLEEYNKLHNRLSHSLRTLNKQFVSTSKDINLARIVSSGQDLTKIISVLSKLDDSFSGPIEQIELMRETLRRVFKGVNTHGLTDISKFIKQVLKELYQVKAAIDEIEREAASSSFRQKFGMSAGEMVQLASQKASGQRTETQETSAADLSRQKMGMSAREMVEQASQAAKERANVEEKSTQASQDTRTELEKLEQAYVLLRAQAERQIAAHSHNAELVESISKQLSLFRIQLASEYKKSGLSQGDIIGKITDLGQKGEQIAGTPATDPSSQSSRKIKSIISEITDAALQAEEQKQDSIKDTARVQRQLRESGQDLRAAQMSAAAVEQAEEQKQKVIRETIREMQRASMESMSREAGASKLNFINYRKTKVRREFNRQTKEHIQNEAARQIATQRAGRAIRTETQLRESGQGLRDAKILAAAVVKAEDQKQSAIRETIREMQRASMEEMSYNAGRSYGAYQKYKKRKEDREANKQIVPNVEPQLRQAGQRLRNAQMAAAAVKKVEETTQQAIEDLRNEIEKLAQEWLAAGKAGAQAMEQFGEGSTEFQNSLKETSRLYDELESKYKQLGYSEQQTKQAMRDIAVNKTSRSQTQADTEVKSDNAAYNESRKKALAALQATNKLEDSLKDLASASASFEDARTTENLEHLRKYALYAAQAIKELNVVTGKNSNVTFDNETAQKALSSAIKGIHDDLDKLIVKQKKSAATGDVIGVGVPERTAVGMGETRLKQLNADLEKSQQAFVDAKVEEKKASTARFDIEKKQGGFRAREKVLTDDIQRERDKINKLTSDIENYRGELTNLAQAEDEARNNIKQLTAELGKFGEQQKFIEQRLKEAPQEIEKYEIALGLATEEYDNLVRNQQQWQKKFEEAYDRAPKVVKEFYDQLNNPTNQKIQKLEVEFATAIGSEREQIAKKIAQARDKERQKLEKAFEKRVKQEGAVGGSPYGDLKSAYDELKRAKQPLLDAQVKKEKASFGLEGRKKASSELQRELEQSQQAERDVRHDLEALESSLRNIEYNIRTTNQKLTEAELNLGKNIELHRNNIKEYEKQIEEVRKAAEQLEPEITRRVSESQARDDERSKALLAKHDAESKVRAEERAGDHRSRLDKELNNVLEFARAFRNDRTDEALEQLLKAAQEAASALRGIKSRTEIDYKVELDDDIAQKAINQARNNIYSTINDLREKLPTPTQTPTWQINTEEVEASAQAQKKAVQQTAQQQEQAAEEATAATEKQQESTEELIDTVERLRKEYVALASKSEALALESSVQLQGAGKRMGDAGAAYQAQKESKQKLEQLKSELAKAGMGEGEIDDIITALNKEARQSSDYAQAKKRIEQEQRRIEAERSRVRDSIRGLQHESMSRFTQERAGEQQAFRSSADTDSHYDNVNKALSKLVKTAKLYDETANDATLHLVRTEAKNAARAIEEVNQLSGRNNKFSVEGATAQQALAAALKRTNDTLDERIEKEKQMPAGGAGGAGGGGGQPPGGPGGGGGTPPGGGGDDDADRRRKDIIDKQNQRLDEEIRAIKDAIEGFTRRIQRMAGDIVSQIDIDEEGRVDVPDDLRKMVQRRDELTDALIGLQARRKAQDPERQFQDEIESTVAAGKKLESVLRMMESGLNKNLRDLEAYADKHGMTLEESVGMLKGIYDEVQGSSKKIDAAYNRIINKRNAVEAANERAARKEVSDERRKLDEILKRNNTHIQQRLHSLKVLERGNLNTVNSIAAAIKEQYESGVSPEQIPQNLYKELGLSFDPDFVKNRLKYAPDVLEEELFGSIDRAVKSGGTARDAAESFSKQLKLGFDVDFIETEIQKKLNAGLDASGAAKELSKELFSAFDSRDIKGGLNKAFEGIKQQTSVFDRIFGTKKLNRSVKQAAQQISKQLDLDLDVDFIEEKLQEQLKLGLRGKDAVAQAVQNLEQEFQNLTIENTLFSAFDKLIKSGGTAKEAAKQFSKQLNLGFDVDFIESKIQEQLDAGLDAREASNNLGKQLKAAINVSELQNKLKQGFDIDEVSKEISQDLFKSLGVATSPTQGIDYHKLLKDYGHLPGAYDKITNAMRKADDANDKFLDSLQKVPGTIEYLDQQMSKANVRFFTYTNILQDVRYSLVEFARITRRITASIVQVGAEFETYERGLRVVEGSTLKANARLNDLLDLSDRLVGIDTAVLIKYANQLRSAGVAAKDTNLVIEGITKSLSEMGKGTHEAERVLRQLTQGIAGQKIVLQDLRPIVEEIPRLWVASSNAFGTTINNVEQLRETVAAQGLTPREGLLKLVKELHRTAKGADINTYAAQVDFLKDRFRRLQGEIGKQFLPQIIDVSKFLNIMLQGLNDSSNTIKSIIGGIIGATTGFAHIFSGATTGIIGFVTILQGREAKTAFKTFIQAQRAMVEEGSLAAQHLDRGSKALANSYKWVKLGTIALGAFVTAVLLVKNAYKQLNAENEITAESFKKILNIKYDVANAQITGTKYALDSLKDSLLDVQIENRETIKEFNKFWQIIETKDRDLWLGIGKERARTFIKIKTDAGLFRSLAEEFAVDNPFTGIGRSGKLAEFLAAEEQNEQITEIFSQIEGFETLSVREKIKELDIAFKRFSKLKFSFKREEIQDNTKLIKDFKEAYSNLAKSVDTKDLKLTSDLFQNIGTIDYDFDGQSINQVAREIERLISLGKLGVKETNEILEAIKNLRQYSPHPELTKIDLMLKSLLESMQDVHKQAKQTDLTLNSKDLQHQLIDVELAIERIQEKISDLGEGKEFDFKVKMDISSIEKEVMKPDIIEKDVVKKVESKIKEADSNIKSAIKGLEQAGKDYEDRVAGYIARIRTSEGGLNKPDKEDSSTWSYAGIMQPTWTEFRGKRTDIPASVEDLKGQTDAINEFYEDYFKKKRVPEMPDFLEYMYADVQYHTGNKGLKIVQRMLGLDEKNIDGVWGPVTEKAVSDWHKVILEKLKKDPAHAEEIIKTFADHTQKYFDYRKVQGAKPGASALEKYYHTNAESVKKRNIKVRKQALADWKQNSQKYVKGISEVVKQTDKSLDSTLTAAPDIDPKYFKQVTDILESMYSDIDTGEDHGLKIVQRMLGVHATGTLNKVTKQAIENWYTEIEQGLATDSDYANKVVSNFNKERIEFYQKLQRGSLKRVQSFLGAETTGEWDQLTQRLVNQFQQEVKDGLAEGYNRSTEDIQKAIEIHANYDKSLGHWLRSSGRSVFIAQSELDKISEEFSKSTTDSSESIKVAVKETNKNLQDTFSLSDVGIKKVFTADRDPIVAPLVDGIEKSNVLLKSALDDTQKIVAGPFDYLLNINQKVTELSKLKGIETAQQRLQTRRQGFIFDPSQVPNLTQQRLDEADKLFDELIEKERKKEKIQRGLEQEAFDKSEQTEEDKQELKRANYQLEQQLIRRIEVIERERYNLKEKIEKESFEKWRDIQEKRVEKAREFENRILTYRIEAIRTRQEFDKQNLEYFVKELNYSLSKFKDELKLDFDVDELLQQSPTGVDSFLAEQRDNAIKALESHHKKIRDATEKQYQLDRAQIKENSKISLSEAKAEHTNLSDLAREAIKIGVKERRDLEVLEKNHKDTLRSLGKAKSNDITKVSDDITNLYDGYLDKRNEQLQKEIEEERNHTEELRKIYQKRREIIASIDLTDIDKNLQEMETDLNIGQEYFKLIDQRKKIAEEQSKAKQDARVADYRAAQKSVEDERNLLIYQGKYTESEQKRLNNQLIILKQQFVNDGIKLTQELRDELSGYEDQEKQALLSLTDAQKKFAKDYRDTLKSANIEITPIIEEKIALLLKSMPAKEYEEYMDMFKDEVDAHKENLKELEDIEKEKRKAFKDTYKLFIKLTTEALKVYDEFLESGKIKGSGRLLGGLIGAGIGFFTGGPSGALAGYQGGSQIGAELGPILNRALEVETFHSSINDDIAAREGRKIRATTAQERQTVKRNAKDFTEHFGEGFSKTPLNNQAGGDNIIIPKGTKFEMKIDVNKKTTQQVAFTIDSLVRNHRK